MAENSVTTTFFANEEAAAAAIARLEKKFDDLENKMRHAHKESHDGAKHAAEAVSELGLMAVSSAVGFTSLIGLVERFGESAAEARKEAEAAAKAGEALEKRLAIQSGRFGVAGEKNIEAVSQGAFAAGRSRDETGALFAALLRQGGLSPEQAQGSIESQAKAFAATFEASGGQTTQAGYARALKASLDKSQAATPETLGSAARNLFAAMQGTGLSDEDVTTSAHQFSTLGANPRTRFRKQAALREIGLKLEDIDLQGEDVFTATGRIAQGLEKVKPGRREELKELIFGDQLLGNRMLRARADGRQRGDLRSVCRGSHDRPRRAGPPGGAGQGIASRAAIEPG